MTKRISLVVYSMLLVLLAGVGSRAAEVHHSHTGVPAPGVLMGCSYLEHEPDRQMDLWRDITVWGFIYNNTADPVTIDWRTRRLHCECHKGDGADNSHHDYEGLTEIPAGRILFFHNAFYFFHGCGEDWQYEVADKAGHVYRFRAWPQETNYGWFQDLPKPIQETIAHAFMADDMVRYKWWYKEQPIP